MLKNNLVSEALFLFFERLARLWTLLQLLCSMREESCTECVQERAGIIFKHYRELVIEQDAQEWFAIILGDGLDSADVG